MHIVLDVQVDDLEMLNEKIKTFMQQHNETVREGSMDLFFFKDAMVHLIKVRYHTMKSNTYLYYP